MCYTLLNSKTPLMYIDHLKRGAGGVLSHDEGYFGSQEGFCTLRKWPRDHTVCVRMWPEVLYL